MQANKFLSIMNGYGRYLSHLGSGRQFDVYSHQDLSFVLKVPLPDGTIVEKRDALEGYELGIDFLRGIIPPTSVVSYRDLTIGDIVGYNGPLIVQRKGTVFPESVSATLKHNGVGNAANIISRLVETDRQILLRGIIAVDVDLSNYLVEDGEVSLHDLGILTSLDGLSQKFGQYYPQIKRKVQSRRGFFQYKRLAYLSMIGQELADAYREISGLPFQPNVQFIFNQDDMSAAAREVLYYASLLTDSGKEQVMDPISFMRAGIEGRLNNRKLEDMVQEIVAKTKYADEFEELGIFDLKNLAEAPWGEKAEPFIDVI